MKKLIISILFGLFSVSASAFDYHGIKSGMTKDEMQAILKCESETCKFGDDDDPKDNPALDVFFGEIKPHGLKQIEFAYTHDNKLWRIRLKFEQYKFGIAMPVVFKSALEKKYPDASIDEETDRSGYFPVTVYYAFLIDSQLFAADVKHWQDEFIKTF